MKSLIKQFKVILATLFATATTVEFCSAQMAIKVSDFGALPNDGQCDAKQIRAAIASASRAPNVKIRFQAGTYNLTEANIANRNGRLSMLHLWHLKNWVIEGATDTEGNPATTLEMNLTLRNEVTGARHLDIRNCEGFITKNLIIDQNPRMASAGEILEVDRTTGTITIEVFKGMPHFDGMASFSANNWDLDTRLLIKGPPITIGTNSAKFSKWKAIPNTNRRYTIINPKMAKLVKTGQGISFHFNVIIPQGRSIDAYRCIDIKFENIRVHNSIGMVIGAGDNRNVTLKKFHIIPEGNSLAVGPRDGIHMSRSTGKLLMDDVIVKGVRWDPLVSYMYTAPIAKKLSNKSISLDTSNSKSRQLLQVVRAGSSIHFWTGKDPTERVISRINKGTITFTEPLDPSVTAKGIISPGEWHWTNAVIRNSKIEANYGTGLVYEGDNLLVEKCVFNNNSYSNIGLGATSANAGLFTRNITIRNNLFKASTWQPKYTASYLEEHRGTITLFNKSPLFTTQQYHRNIIIRDNVFQDLTGKNNPVAIDVKLAENVTIADNRYINVATKIILDNATTENVKITESEKKTK